MMGLCYVMQCNAMLCCAVQYFDVPCNFGVVPFCVVLCYVLFTSRYFYAVFILCYVLRLMFFVICMGNPFALNGSIFKALVCPVIF